MEILKLENIYKRFGQSAALRDVSLSVQKGRIYGLLGPNGAGKTTLIRIINKIIQPDQGCVYVNGREMIQEDVFSIGYLPEERGLYHKMRVKDYLLFIGRLKNMSKQEATVAIADWASKLKFEEWQHKKIGELSKGMAQKIQFVATIINAPDLIILDEPFSGFDPVNAEIIRKEILLLKQQGKTIILSTHNMASVEELCDHIFLINNSEKILDGNVEDLKEKVEEKVYSIQFKGVMMAFANALWAGYEIIDKKDLGNERAKVWLKMRQGNKINDLFDTVKNVVEIEAVQEEKPTINEIFISTVNRREGGNNE
ncbi:MAG: ATP-binding cassette domain-containing protein [Crocinitomicaceae bacterium]